MPVCCDTAPEPLQSKSQLTVALAGNPNSGKTTIFNALTGLRQKVANYPGVTVEKKTGRCKLPSGIWASVIDLPGTYSLISHSPDEHVAMEVLRGLRPDTPAPDVVIVVVDASNLQRNLYLVSQLIEMGKPLVVALNMMDVAERRGLLVHPETLEKELGVPVIPVVGYKRKGIDQLKAAITQARIAPMPNWVLPDPMREELLIVGGGLAILNSEGLRTEDSGLRAEKGSSSSPQSLVLSPQSSGSLDHYQALAERLLIGDRGNDLGEIARHEPVASLLSSATNRLLALGIDPMQADIEAHYRWIDSVAHQVVHEIDVANVAPGGVLSYETPKRRNLTERVDSILIHKIWGLVIFALIMGSLFVTIFWLAQPIMDALQGAVGWLGKIVTHRMADGPVKDLIASGIFKGVGAVIVFVPQIALLFLFLAVLEDSGYLARAAFLMDRLLAKVGLHGKSFIPLLSSFACAIPGIMATRTIENRKDRLATILIAPFMSCSARLPVYTLLIGTFFIRSGPLAQAGIMLALYALGIAAAAGTALVFKRSLLKGPKAAFILEMPTYKVPQLSQVARQVWSNSWAFLSKAGTTIFCLSVILWAMSYYPRLPKARVAQIEATARPEARTRVAQERDLTSNRAPYFFTSPTTEDELEKYREYGRTVALSEVEEAEADEAVKKVVAGQQSAYSLSGRMGHAIEPIFRPLGFDWKMDVGLVGAFAAREVFVSTMGIIYSVGDTEEGGTADLSKAMQNDKYANGRPVWTPLVAVSLLVWFVLAMQCMSTVAVVRRETGGWSWPIFMILYMNGLAYVASLLVFQVGRLIFHA